MNVRPIHERDRDTTRASATRAADAVNVCFVVLGARVIDDVRDTGDVDAASCHIGSNKDVDLAFAEPIERLLAGLLRHVAVQRRSLETAFGQIIGDPLGGAFRAREDHDTTRAVGLQDASHHFGLVHFVRLPHELLRGGNRLIGFGGFGTNVHRLIHVLARQRDDRSRHRGREQHRLARRRRLGQNRFHVRQEAQVEHLVGLVEHERVDIRQVKIAAVHQIQNTTGRTDDNVDALIERFELRFVRNATVNREVADVEVLRGSLDIARHLDRQFACRCDDERLGLACFASRSIGFAHDPLDDRNRKRKCLASARASLADQVSARQGDRQGHLLDRESFSDADRAQGVGDGRDNAQFCESSQGSSQISCEVRFFSVYRLPDMAITIASRYAPTMSSDVSPASSPVAHEGAFADPDYLAGVIELLGLLSFGEVSACERLTDDAKLAPDLRTKCQLYAMAASEWDHFLQLRDRIEELGRDPYDVMEPFKETFERFHIKTEPADWLEGILKAYVGDGLAADFYSEIAAFLDADTRDLVLRTMSQTGSSQFVVDQVRLAIDEDPKIAGRLALWSRRLMGEALSQAQMVVAERDSLAAVVVGGVDHPGGFDLAAIGRMFTRITEAHAERMNTLGLSA